MNDSSAFRFVLRCLRQAAQMDVNYLAYRAGISASALRHLERGFRAPKWQTVCALADVLGVGTDAFREGPNEKPVLSNALRDARLAGLGQWHREESARRRLADAARGVRQTADQIARQIGMEDVSPEAVAARRAELSRAAGGLTFLGSSTPEQDARLIEVIDRVETDLSADLPADVFEPNIIEADQADGDQAEAEQFGPVPGGGRIEAVLKYQADLGRLDRGDKRALTQARRRSLKRGADQLAADLAGYAAVVRHREMTREAEKPSARTHQDRRSRVKPTLEPSKKRRKGRAAD